MLGVVLPEQQFRKVRPLPAARFEAIQIGLLSEFELLVETERQK